MLQNYIIYPILGIILVALYGAFMNIYDEYLFLKLKNKSKIKFN